MDIQDVKSEDVGLTVKERADVGGGAAMIAMDKLLDVGTSFGADGDEQVAVIERGKGQRVDHLLAETWGTAVEDAQRGLLADGEGGQRVECGEIKLLDRPGDPDQTGIGLADFCIVVGEGLALSKRDLLQSSDLYEWQ